MLFYNSLPFIYLMFIFLTNILIFVLRLLYILVVRAAPSGYIFLVSYSEEKDYAAAMFFCKS